MSGVLVVSVLSCRLRCVGFGFLRPCPSEAEAAVLNMQAARWARDYVDYCRGVLAFRVSAPAGGQVLFDGMSKVFIARPRHTAGSLAGCPGGELAGSDARLSRTRH